MPNVTLTEEQAKIVIYNLCYYYQSFGEAISLNTAHDVAVETNSLLYFDGIVRALNIVYPIPVEPGPVDPLA